MARDGPTALPINTIPKMVCPLFEFFCPLPFPLTIYACEHAANANGLSPTSIQSKLLLFSCAGGHPGLPSHSRGSFSTPDVQRRISSLCPALGRWKERCWAKLGTLHLENALPNLCFLLLVWQGALQVQNYQNCSSFNQITDRIFLVVECIHCCCCFHMTYSCCHCCCWAYC